MPRLLSVVVLVSLLATAASAAVPDPMVEGPVSGGLGKPAIAATFFDLSKVGYAETEYFVSGTATAFTTATPLTSDGKWSVTPGTTAPYKTRVVRFAPTDATKFKGTVIVEWLNVSLAEVGADWITAHTEMIRDGMAWVGVSAQQLGVEGGTTIGGVPARGVKDVDPVRYATLSHPGDSFSYDIYSQVGQAIRHPGATSILGDLKARKVIAIGESQSAFRLTTYVDGIHPLANVYDGFLIHSRGGGGGLLGGPLSEAPQPSIPTPSPTLIRTDVRVPVLIFETETDLVDLAYFSARQPDTNHIRLWEVAGTSHADSYTLGTGLGDLGNSSATAAIVFGNHGLGCAKPVNSGPQHWVLDAAFAALDRWVRHKRPPAKAPRLQVSAGPPVTIARDDHGNALGGIRTPWVDAPVATLSGEGNAGGGFCSIFGTTTPLDAPTLAALYPTHEAFVAAYKRSLRRAVKRHYIVPADAALIKAWAEASDVGG